MTGAFLIIALLLFVGILIAKPLLNLLSRFWQVEFIGKITGKDENAMILNGEGNLIELIAQGWDGMSDHRR